MQSTYRSGPDRVASLGELPQYRASAGFVQWLNPMPKRVSPQKYSGCFSSNWVDSYPKLTKASKLCISMFLGTKAMSVLFIIIFAGPTYIVLASKAYVALQPMARDKPSYDNT